MKSFYWKLFLCVAPLVLGGAIVANAFYRYFHDEGGFKLGVDLVGGTDLVYEIDTSRWKNDTPPDDYNAAKLAAKLKQRIDPNDLKNVTIRPIGQTRIELVLPFGGGSSGKTDFTQNEVDQVKERITQVGNLRFTILANRRDDEEAFAATDQLFKSANIKATLDSARDTGKQPPTPVSPEAEGFNVTTAAGAIGRYTYTWVELGKEQRKLHQLDNNSENSMFWKIAERARTGNTNGLFHDLDDRHLYYSRSVPPERDEEFAKVNKGERKKYEYFILTRDAEPGKEVTGQYLVHADASTDNKTSTPAVSFTFSNEGGNLFFDLTTKNRPTDISSNDKFYRDLAIVLDGYIVSVARLNEPIHDSGQISGNFTKERVDSLVSILRSGALPESLKPNPVSENTKGATLGADTIRKGSISVLLAFAAVLIFMIVYYHYAGVIACLALFANLLLTVAVMVLVQATFTLPGLAGLVLMMGMAVDANVLIYERLREELDRKAPLVMALRNAYDKALPTIIDTHLTSIFTAVVLYLVGNDQLRGFGITLTLGLIISLFTSLFVTRFLFDVSIARGWLKNVTMMHIFRRVPAIDFMRIRYYWFTATIALTIIGGAVFFYRLDKGGLNIDFTGGTLYSGTLDKPVDFGTLRDALGESKQGELLKVAEVQEVDTEGGRKGYNFRIKFAGEDRSRLIALPNPDTVENVTKRVSETEDLSPEQDFPSGQEGNKSPYFTIKSADRSPELVQAKIDRLLSGDVKLKKILMSYVEVKDAAETEDGRKIVYDLTFSSATGQPEFASDAQVRRLLEREFKAEGGELARQASLFTLTNIDTPETKQAERFSKMSLKVNKVNADLLKDAIKKTADAFAERPQPERLENFDSQLAGATRLSALYAILASWGAILLYLWFRFGSWTFGAATVLCLIHDLFFTLGAIGLAHFLHGTFLGNILGLGDFKIDSNTVAALLTLVGYSVSDTIVVFDRIREVRGKNPELTPKMINDAVNQALSRTLLTSVTVWLVVIVLYIFGGEGVHLFAFVMVVGVVVGTYSSIYIASPLLLIFGEGRLAAGQKTAVPQSAMR